MPYIHIATEDALSEAVGLKLISTFLSGFDVGVMLRKNGNGYLKSKIASFCQMARHAPLLLITDLDNANCAPSLKASWLRNIIPPDDLIFRVAVREVEAWLLADHRTMRRLIGEQARRLPPDPESVLNPKELLLTLVARGAPRDVKRDLLVKRGSVASQGLGYNQRLCHHVNAAWNPQKAAERSDSLARLIRRLNDLSERR
jgi:hypothetical protein